LFELFQSSIRPQDSLKPIQNNSETMSVSGQAPRRIFASACFIALPGGHTRAYSRSMNLYLAS
jgi:hypothetical protein